MKMPAGLLLRRAAGMKDGGALVRREAGQFHFLEHRRRHGGNLRPIFHRLRRELARDANFAVGGIVSNWSANSSSASGANGKLEMGN